MQVNTTWLWLLYAVCCVPSVIMWTRDCLRRTPPESTRSTRAIAWADGIMFGIGTGLAISFGVLIAGSVMFRLTN
jgi:hypothetical protein